MLTGVQIKNSKIIPVKIESLVIPVLTKVLTPDASGTYL